MVTQITNEVKRKILELFRAREIYFFFQDGTVKRLPVELATSDSDSRIRATEGFNHSGRIERVELRDDSGGVVLTLQGRQLDSIFNNEFRPELNLE